MARYVSPSKIQFTTAMDENDIKQSVNRVFKNIHTRAGEPPVIQVVERQGEFFAINNSKLETCRMLETQGKCAKVRLDILPLHLLPTEIQKFIFKQQTLAETFAKQRTANSSRAEASELSALCSDVIGAEDGDESCEESYTYDSSSESDGDIFDMRDLSHEPHRVRSDDDFNDDDEQGHLLS